MLLLVFSSSSAASTAASLDSSAVPWLTLRSVCFALLRGSLSLSLSLYQERTAARPRLPPSSACAHPLSLSLALYLPSLNDCLLSRRPLWLTCLEDRIAYCSGSPVLQALPGYEISITPRTQASAYSVGRSVQKKKPPWKACGLEEKSDWRGFSYLVPQAFNALCIFLDAAPQALNQRAGIGEHRGTPNVWCAWSLVGFTDKMMSSATYRVLRWPSVRLPFGVIPAGISSSWGHLVPCLSKAIQRPQDHVIRSPQ